MVEIAPSRARPLRTERDFRVAAASNNVLRPNQVVDKKSKNCKF
jgi:hypothetical protein